LKLDRRTRANFSSEVSDDCEKTIRSTVKNRETGWFRASGIWKYLFLPNLLAEWAANLQIESGVEA